MELFSTGLLAAPRGSGGGPEVNYTEVANFAALPAASGANSGEIYAVLAPQGVYFVNRKPAGYYLSDGATWSYLGDLSDPYFSDGVLAFSDDLDSSKKLMFQLSSIATGTTRTVTWPNTTGVVPVVAGTAHRLIYINGTGEPTELGYGADGTFLKSGGAAVTPTWATPAGSGDVSKVGTPVDNQVAVWTGSGTIEGTTGLTYDGVALGLTGNLTVSGTVDGRDVAADGTKLDGIAANANNYVHPNHSGDVTSVADGATTIATDVVTNAKLADVATSTIKGRVTALTGDPEDLTPAQVRTLINVADGANAYVHPNHTGDVTSTADGATAIAAGVIVNADINASAAIALSKLATDPLARGNHTGTQAASTIGDFDTAVAANSAVAANTAKVTNATHTGEVTGETALTIAADVVTNTKLANVATATIKGRITAATGDPEDLTAAQARTVLNVADGANNYAHPNHTGDVTSTGDGATAIAAGVIVNADVNASAGIVVSKLAGTAHRLLHVDGAGVVAEIGYGADGTYLKSGGAAVTPTWATPGGSGDVSKVGTPVDNQVGVWTGNGTIEGTTGLTYDGTALGITGNITVSGTVDGRDVATDGTKLDGVAANANNYVHPNHSGDVTSVADGATTIGNNVVTNAKAADMATSTIKGRVTAATGDPEDLTAAQARTVLNVADGANNYSHPNHTGDVTSTGDGATAIAAGVVTNAKLADVATSTIKGRITAGTGVPEDLTAANVRTIINVADGANNYVLPAPTTTVIGGVKRNVGAGGEFVTGISTAGDLEYGTPSGGGDVTLAGAQTFTGQKTTNLSFIVPRTDLAAGTALTLNTHYFVSMSAARTLTFTGTPVEGSSTSLKITTTAAFTLTFPSCKRSGGSSSAITTLALETGKVYTLMWTYVGAEYVLVDSVGSTVSLTADVTGTLPIANGGTDATTAAAAFTNIKQAASETATGVVELATSAETTAGLVVQASDTRLSDARTPTAHASTHVTGGSDKIRDATASQDGLMTAAYATKLDGVATSANNYVHPNHSGDVTSVADGATTIAADAVTNAKAANMAVNTIKGRVTAGTGDPEDLTAAQARTVMAVAEVSGLAKITVAATAPTSPGTGDLWVDTA